MVKTGEKATNDILQCIQPKPMIFGCCGEGRARPEAFRLRITAPHWSPVAVQRVASCFTKARVICLTGVRALCVRSESSFVS